MIKKSEEQFDSGGIILAHTFLLPFEVTKNFIGDEVEKVVDDYIEDACINFRFDLKLSLMIKLGYVGMVGDKWVKTMEIDDIKKIVTGYKTKYEEGFTGEEIEEFLSSYYNIDSIKFRQAMFGNTCMVIDNQTIYYHVDVIKSLYCVLENRDQTSEEWD